MVKDYWPDLYEDIYAIKRLEKSVELADIRPGHTVLDVGCHLGELEVYMPVEAQYTGIDYITGHDIDGGFDASGKFDRIFCLETLEHLKFPRKTLAAIAYHLKPGGICVISLPNEVSIFHRLRCLCLGYSDAEAFSEDGKHLHLPSFRQSKEFVQSEFQIDRIDPYISRSAAASRQKWLGALLELIPESAFLWLARKLPSLFARGFIFVCKKK